MPDPGLEPGTDVERLATVLALEIVRVVEDLEGRLDFLVEVWGRYRTRDVFIDTIFDRWRTLSARDLLLLESDTLVKVETFYRTLDQLRLYLAYTEDMPVTLRDRLDRATGRLRTLGDQAIDALGGLPERPGHETMEAPWESEPE